MMDRQLGREGQEEKDDGQRPHAIAQARPAQGTQWFPEGHTQGREGTGESGVRKKRCEERVRDFMRGGMAHGILRRTSTSNGTVAASQAE